MAPDHQHADSVATAGSSIMHGDVVTNAHDVDGPLATKTPVSGVAAAEPEITQRDVHTASSFSAQHRYPKGSTRESNLVEQAALRRSSAKSRDVAQKTSPAPSSTASSKPVLVRAPSKSEMNKKPKPGIDTDSPKVPPLESFSIQDILASVGPEAAASIDAIAEICGRSKMSLAEEHGSHRPPHHVEVVNTGISPAESLPSMRLEPVAEAANGPRTRSKSRSLALANASGEQIASDATAATSNVTSLAQSNTPSSGRNNVLSEPVPAPLLSQIFAWLRRSNISSEASNTSERDPSAVKVLQNMLSDNDSLRS